VEIAIFITSANFQCFKAITQATIPISGMKLNQFEKINFVIIYSPYTMEEIKSYIFLFKEFVFIIRFFLFPRYGHGDASWSKAYENLMSCKGLSSTHNLGAGFYGTMGERIFGINYSSWANCNFHRGTSTFGEQSAWRTHESLHTQPRLTPIDHLNPVITHLKAEIVQDHTSSSNSNVPSDFNKTSNQQEWKTSKRKASDCNLDLDLSLRLTSSRFNDDENHRSLRDHKVDVHSNLSLSLYSQSSSSPTSLKEGRVDGNKKQAKCASTLDLTI
jgi:hypothetical protein